MSLGCHFLLYCSLQRAYIFGKTVSAVTTPGRQKVIADSPIRANAFAHMLNVHAYFVGQVAQLGHEADGGWPAWRWRIFGELGAFDVHHQNAFMVAGKWRIELAHGSQRLLACCIVRRAQHNAIGAHEVFYGCAFFQEFGVADD